MSRRQIDPEAFARLWACEDVNTEAIARFLGVTRQAVSDRARRAGLPSRRHRRNKLIDDAMFTAMWMAGVHTEDIAAHFGLAHRACCRAAVDRLGLPKRTRVRGSRNRGGWAETIRISSFSIDEAWIGKRMAELVASERKNAPRSRTG